MEIKCVIERGTKRGNWGRKKSEVKDGKERKEKETGKGIEKPRQKG
jgi:hypothetical protein